MKKMIALGLLVMFVFLVACTSNEKLCKIDADCVPSVCCHADDTVNRENAPECSGKLCTMECVEGTIDCGQGEIKCLEGQCTVIFNE